MEPDYTYNSDGLECPYCGYIDRDAWELGDCNSECGETECNSCGEDIIWIRSVSTSYLGKPKLKK